MSNDENDRILELEEQKRILLRKKQELLDRIEKYKNLNKDDNDDDEEDEDESWKGLIYNNSFPKPNDLSNENSKLFKIDGNSNIEDELLSKLDTLPILNKDLRLKYLQRAYPFVDIKILDTSINDSKLQFEISFKNKHTNNSVQFEMISEQNKITSFKVINSDNFSSCNLKNISSPNILLNLIELDRLEFKRHKFFQRLSNKISQKNQNINIEIIENNSCLKLNRLIFRNFPNENIKLDLYIYWNIQLDTTTNEINTDWFIKLNKNDQLLKNKIDLNVIWRKLIKEYGIEVGTEELIKICLFPT
ncbi:hypothetical protein TBLA_0D02610 [Henningerozyma blattae CBS 6284]|uniref:Uncharacterized protein n=1 Tax=Henningerozyma blattae (strain ATCC 34711 / CBS 6284 / DSM 70876 / NBRC 10599 / NRRL Y-10934 / UCD 77-7) TaxID=1071380 RepID=I2H312_HENB6|nr:hypothetical protein TBLA_0D02610 [Tetrapisispora blattae CBS 6284]CCH60764.1 hypothetical protein TBLA_0D02610 [Tetrapisispora blattae CBS 6284]